VLAVIPLPQQRLHDWIREAGKLGGAVGAPEGAGVDGGELLGRQPPAQAPGSLLALRQQGHVGEPGVAPAAAPFGLAVAGEEEVEVGGGYRPSTSGRPVRRPRAAASITAPARKRLAGLTQTSPTAAFRSTGFKASLIVSRSRLAVCAVPDISASGKITTNWAGIRFSTPGVSTSRSEPISAAAIALKPS